MLLNGVDLTLERGEIVLLMGRNGSGKTTLARYLVGLLIPSEGVVMVDGMRTDQDPRAIRRRVGLLFQESHEQIIAQTPLEDVAFGLENLALPSEAIQQRAWRALERVSLREKALWPIEMLTPAERQRVALAGVLAMDPDYYILDEPDRTADREGLVLLRALVQELRAAQKGVLIISHKEFWKKHADRVLCLEGGDLTPHPEISPPTPPPVGANPRVRPGQTQGSAPTGKGARGLGQGRGWGRGAPFRLRALDLSFAYNSAPALQDFSGEITAGEFIVLTGPAGSGKTTLVELLAGLRQPTSGYVLWNDIPIHTLRASERVRCVGLVFQEPYQQLLGESVREELLLGLLAQGVSLSEGEQRARWACEAVGLDWERCSLQPSHHLSGGEQARLAIAAMLALRPQVLILDETLAALDPAGQAELLALLQELHAHGTTVILVTSEEISHVGTRLWRLEGGRLLYDRSWQGEG
uniref:Cobalt/nickel transport system ATP-binding protein n=1 Tax=Acetithermum autotrophicum TaxID=1446466 RepID=H5SRH0_ACEAU|nr:cobalt/nickel transport system ATP-binding protein [Candidatus Acetothermum autotrophicum]